MHTTKMTTLHVFTNENLKYGNPLGIVVDEVGSYDNKARQKLTAESSLSEVVFIDDIEKSQIRIYTPQSEIPFAGHAAVGAAYFLSQKNQAPVTHLTGIKGMIKVWQADGLTWARAELSLTPAWNFEQLAGGSDVEQISLNQTRFKKHTVAWAWLDKANGIIRARSFASDWGIPEDEANGSGCMKLAANLKKDLIIHHGQGSLIYAKPTTATSAEVGGYVRLD